MPVPKIRSGEKKPKQPKRDKVTINLAPGNQDRLEKLAKRLGCVWGERGSISSLMDAVATGELAIDENSIRDPKGIVRSALELALQKLDQL